MASPGAGGLSWFIGPYSLGGNNEHNHESAAYGYGLTQVHQMWKGYFLPGRVLYTGITSPGQ